MSENTDSNVNVRDVAKVTKSMLGEHVEVTIINQASGVLSELSAATKELARQLAAKEAP